MRVPYGTFHNLHDGVGIASFYIKTHDSESRGQEEAATTEWVIYMDHH